MMSTKRFAGLTLVALALSFSVVAASRAEDQDYSNEQYRVDFMPWANRKLTYRDANGNVIGDSLPNAKLEMLIDGNSYRAAITSEGIDVGKLLGQYASQRADGKMYITMNISQDTPLADGSVLRSGTANAPTQVSIDVEDFYVTKTVQPTGTETQTPDAPAGERQTRDRFESTLRTDGVTPPTRPVSPKDAANGQEDVNVQTRADDDDDVDDTPLSFMTPGNQLGMDVYGRAFPTNRIFSSPVCSCLGGHCGVTSGFGSRETFRTKNGRYGSKFHKGIDINTAAHRNGTPIVAAADGYLKIPVKTRRGHKPKCGDPVNPADLFERGYGYTVRMTHGNGFETQYSHLKSIAPTIRWCAAIKRGERIGSMGETGNATGPHLHFGVAVGRRLVDPRPYMIGADGRGTLSGQFFAHTCANQPDYPEIDRGMRDALRGGTHRQADSIINARRRRAAAH